MKRGCLQQNAFADRDMDIYQTMKKKQLKHGGYYFVFSPFYIPMDLEVIKLILQTDFHHFVDRGMYVNERDPLSTHLFNLSGNKWKLLRTKLSPTFTSGKMKMMFENLVECTAALDKAMDKNLGTTVDIKDVLGRFTTDVIVSCAFGLSCNSLENPNNEFRKKGRALFLEKGLLEYIKYGLFFAIPNIMRFFNAKLIPPDVTDFFYGVVKDTVAYREKNDIYRKDFLHLLIQLKNRGQLVDDEKLKTEHITPDENAINMDEIVAQAFLFFEAGLETSATTMTFCLYELASNRDIQDKLRAEIRDVLKRYNGIITYDAVNEMVYLEKVLCETLRKYPPLASLPRICTKDYKLPGTDLIIEKGVRIVIPVYGIQRDPDYYPNPEIFDPERFSEENKNNRNEFTYMPFGYGPRLCIGMRFGIMESKVGLISLLKTYEFKLNPKTQEPLKFDPKVLIMSIKGDIWLDYEKCSKVISG
ncbi:hypothetical protein HHI36_017906 [Cryptolaemus montrouzieri]|uniref:Cytochrome P450 n=1 Tax=Cryptolaemus montrouzieri TaxID=559131 RepID=A0ABD2NP90_9CUCU